MSLTLPDLCTTFRRRAVWTGSLIAKGLSSRLGVLEETITDVNLIEISDQHGQHIVTKKFTRREEGSDSGADWLWCIGAPGAWLSLLVQAKVVNPRTGICQQLNYRGGEQRQLLQQFARKHRFLPLYCVYSHIPKAKGSALDVLHLFSGTAEDEWSCALISPKQVRKLTGAKKKHIRDILPFATPWMSPFCIASHDVERPLAHALAHAFASIRMEVHARELGYSSSDEIVHVVANVENRSAPKRPYVRWEDPNPTDLVSAELPKLAVNLLKSRIRASDSPVASVSIISSVPVQPLLAEMGALPKPADDWPYRAIGLSRQVEYHSRE